MPWITLLTCGSIFAAWMAYSSYQKERRERFAEGLDIVAFSTSMFRHPSAEKVEEAIESAQVQGIDLFLAYQEAPQWKCGAGARTLLGGSSSRFDLAYLFGIQESKDYLAFAKRHIESIPWPEVRIWKFLRVNESLSKDTHEALLELLLSSPTSEAKLFAGKWYAKHGESEQSEDAYLDAMNGSEFFDAFDAACVLVESTRYRNEAIAYLVNILETESEFPAGAAYRIARAAGIRQEVDPIIKSLEGSRDRIARQPLIDRFRQLTR